MKHLSLAALVACLLLAVTLSGDPGLESDVYNATALLYGQDLQGGMKMRCTATVFAAARGGYLLATAAHCVAKDDATHERVVIEKIPFYVTFDESGEKKFYRAEVLAAGYQARGDDFAVLWSKIDKRVTPIALGDESLEEIGAQVINVAGSQGLGRQLFRGYISMLKIDRPVSGESLDWTGAMLLQLPIAGGSSGSAVVSVTQKKIIGFAVGRITSSRDAAIAIPVSRFLAFGEAVQQNKYKWFTPRKD